MGAVTLRLFAGFKNEARNRLMLKEGFLSLQQRPQVRSGELSVVCLLSDGHTPPGVWVLVIVPLVPFPTIRNRQKAQTVHNNCYMFGS